MLLAHGKKSLLPPLVLLPPTHAPSGYVDDERCSLGYVDMVGPELVGQMSDPTYVAPSTHGRQSWSDGRLSRYNRHVSQTTGRRGFGKLQTKAAAFLEYFEATGCEGQAASSVGLVGPWWQGAALAPSQAYPDYAPNCTHSEVSDCIYGAGCGPLRVLFTAGGSTTRVHDNRSQPL